MATRKNNIPGQGRLRLAEADPEQDLSKLSVFVLDAGGKVLGTAPIDKDGQFKLATDVPGAARVAIGEAGGTGDEAAAPRNTVEFHAADFTRRLVEGQDVVISKERAAKIFPISQCVSGSVQKCWRWIFDPVQFEAVNVARIADSSVSAISALPVASIAGTIGPISSLPLYRRCNPVCNALVQVYRRSCCCTPWIYLDPRLDLLKAQLREIVKVIPFPGPGPDPGPLMRPAQLLAGAASLSADRGDKAAIDPQLAANAAIDLKSLETLQPAETLSYIWARPYLTRILCSCSTPQQVASDFVNPDGTFSICWTAPIFSILPVNCHWEYAFKVTQLINGQNVTIYDGVSSGTWFDQTSGITLTTYDYRAVTCHTDPEPVNTDSAYVMLQDIGNTGTYHLSTPNADGPFSVGSPAIHSGLLDADNIVNSTNAGANRNLGGTLRLRIHFSNVAGKSMKALGATHYRVSVALANASGDPTGDRRYYDSVLGWLYYDTDASHHITVQSDRLGPVTIGAGASARTNVYKIPYTNDHDWQEGQWHAYINTNDFANDRYLITIEVFKADGTRLRPIGAPALGDGGEAAANFKYLQWKVETGPTSTHEVPYAALTNMMWWDNRPPVSQLISLSGGGGSAADCQFLSGHATDEISVTVKAYHPNPLFLAGRSLTAYRGIHDTVGNPFTLPPVNFAAPEADVTSNGKQISNLLGPTTTKCSFALVLSTSAKTTDGIGAVWGAAVANGAFALELTP